MSRKPNLGFQDMAFKPSRGCLPPHFLRLLFNFVSQSFILISTYENGLAVLIFCQIFLKNMSMCIHRIQIYYSSIVNRMLLQPSLLIMVLWNELCQLSSIFAVL